MPPTMLPNQALMADKAADGNQAGRDRTGVTLALWSGAASGYRARRDHGRLKRARGEVSMLSLPAFLRPFGTSGSS